MSAQEPPTGSGFEYGLGRHLAPPDPTPPRRRVWPWIAWPVSVVGAFVAGIGLTYQPGEAGATDEESAAPSAAAEDTPDPVSTLEVAKDLCAGTSPHVVLGDGGRSLSIDGAGDERSGAPYDEVICILDSIDLPDAVYARFGNTRALDGMQEATWKEFYATWSYHPDSGVNMVIEVRENP